MSKTLIAFLLLAVLVMSQRGHSTQGHGKLQGGWTQIAEDQLLGMYEDKDYIIVEDLAKQFWKVIKHEELQHAVGLQTQIVSGVNYRLTFIANEGPISITVYSQPWTKTLRVTNILPAIEGITDANGSILDQRHQN